MDPITNAEDYEKSFLERYFTAQTNKKIDILDGKIMNSTNPAQIQDFIKQIKLLQAELKANLSSLDDSVNDKMHSGIKKSAEIFTDNSNEFKIYKNINIPLCIWDYLFVYQQLGVEWMIDLYLKDKGGILADEMGLGKTVQVIAFVAGLFKSHECERVLILCPATIISQWVSEFHKIASEIKITERRISHEKGVFILSYDSFKNMKRVGYFDVVFLDEGHKIKNSSAQITLAVKEINSRSRFVVTGTPIQNNLIELWSIFDFINPGLLGTQIEFQEEFEQRIKKSTSAVDIEVSYDYSVMLRVLIEPFILRRMKREIAHNLPNKNDKVIFMTLTEIQDKLYIKALESLKRKELVGSHGNLFGAIDYLRKICNHPSLIEKDNSLFRESLCKNDNRESLFDDDLNDIDDNVYDVSIDNNIDCSCKLIALMQLLAEWHTQKCKVLIFTQTVQMLRIIKASLQRKSQYKFLTMSGLTPQQHRTELVDSFNVNPDIFIFLLTTRVGGLGLNLTGANRVVIYDPDWNPSTDNQAKERVYRYGQKSEVEIYRLICRNTIEEKIYQKQIYKDCLSKKILNNPNTFISRNAVTDLFEYFSSYETGLKIENEINFLIEEDKLVDIREEDKHSFAIMKEYSTKEILSGRELLEYIERREAGLK